MAKLISLKLEEKMLKEVDKQVRTGLYASRTDFIRDIIREKLELEIKRAEAIEYYEKFRGEGKRIWGREPTKEEIEKAREEAHKKLRKKRGWTFPKDSQA